MNITEAFQRTKENLLDLVGHKPDPCIFIKSLDGSVLDYKEFLPETKEQQYIDSFIKENPKIIIFQVERIQFPNNLHTAYAGELYQEICNNKSPHKDLYNKHMLEKYTYNTKCKLKIHSSFYPSMNLRKKVSLFKSITGTIRYIKNPTATQQMAAVKENPKAIQYITNPTIDVQLAAVKQDPFAIKYIKNPTEEVQLASVESDQSAIRFIAAPTEPVQLVAIDNIPEIISEINAPTEKVQIISVKYDPNLIKDIANPTEKAQLIAVKRDSYLIKDIVNPTEKVQLAAIERYPDNIQYITNPTEKVQIKVLSKYPEQFLKVNNITSNAAKTAIENLYNIKVTSDINMDSGRQLFTKLHEIDCNYLELCHNATSWAEVNKIDIGREEQITDVLKSFFPKFAHEKSEIVGSVSFYLNGKIAEIILFDNLEDYLKCIKNELYYNPDGFTCETLTENAEVRKAVADLYYDNCGIDNPHPLEYYQKTLRNQELQCSGNKTLIGDTSFPTSKDPEIVNLRIQDKFTGKTEPLDTGNIDLSKQSPEAIKSLLSGGKVEMTDRSGINNLVGLSKTPLGWGLQIGKQVFNIADSSAEI